MHLSQRIHLVQQNISLRGKIYIALCIVLCRSCSRKRSAIEQDIQRLTAGNCKLPASNRIVRPLRSGQSHTFRRRKRSRVNFRKCFIINDLITADCTAGKRDILALYVGILDYIIGICKRLCLPLRLCHSIHIGKIGKLQTRKLFLCPPCILLYRAFIGVSQRIPECILIGIRCLGNPVICLQLVIIFQLRLLISRQLCLILRARTIGILQGLLLRSTCRIDLLPVAVLRYPVVARPVFLIRSIHIQAIIILSIDQTLLRGIAALNKPQTGPVFRELIPAALIDVLIDLVVHKRACGLDIYITRIRNNTINKEIPLLVIKIYISMRPGINAIISSGRCRSLRIIDSAICRQRRTGLNAQHAILRTQRAIIRHEIHAVCLNQAVCTCIQNTAVCFKNYFGGSPFTCIHGNLIHTEVTIGFLKIDKRIALCSHSTCTDGLRSKLCSRMRAIV